MRVLDATVTTFLEIELVLLSELKALQDERKWLRNFDGPKLLTRTSRRDVFNTRVEALMQLARSRLRALCYQAGALGHTLEALECVDAEGGERVRQAVERSKSAARQLDEVQRFNRDITARALDALRRFTGVSTPALRAGTVTILTSNTLSKSV